VTVPAWAWAAFVAFVLAMLALDLFVLHRRAHEVSLKEAGAWTAVGGAIGLGFAALLWAWQGGGTAQAYLAGYLIEKSLSLDNVFGAYMIDNILISLAGVVSFIMFTVLRVPFSVPLALVVALCDLIPLVGAVISVLIALLATVPWPTTVLVAGFFLVYQQLSTSCRRRPEHLLDR
jgi:hypothetical protein